MYFTISEISNNDYVLLGENDALYVVTLCFQDVDAPKVGDKLLIDINLLDKDSQSYSPPYTFGKIDSEYGNSEKIKENFIYIKSKDKTIEYKRLFG